MVIRSRMQCSISDGLADKDIGLIPLSRFGKLGLVFTGSVHCDASVYDYRLKNRLSTFIRSYSYENFVSQIGLLKEHSSVPPRTGTAQNIIAHFFIFIIHLVEYSAMPLTNLFLCQNSVVYEKITGYQIGGVERLVTVI